MDKTIDHRLAWLAGIIDGEGWIGLSLQKSPPSERKKAHGRTFMSIKWYVAVTNTDEAMLAEILSIADVLGVAAFHTPIKAREGNRQPQGRVTFHTRPACAAILRAVHPYLVTKRARAELMLRAISHRNTTASPGRYPDRRGYLSVDRDTALLGMVDEMHRLNHRGKEATHGNE